METRSRLLQRTIFFAAAFFATIVFLTYPPRETSAAGLDADLQCVPAIPPCPCGTIMGPKGCVPGLNKFGCPCFDITSGFKTAGICDATMKCTAKSTQNQQGGEGMPKMPEIPKGGGGGGGGEQGASQDPCLYGSFGINTAGSSGASTSSENGACPQASTYTPPSSYSDITGGIFSPVGANGFANDLLGNLNAPAATEAAATTPVAATPSKDAAVKNDSGVFGDIVVKDTSVLTTVSTRDTKTNTQVSGFVGIQTKDKASAQELAIGLCSGRPWLTNFLSAIVPSSLLDKVCVTKKIVTSVPAAQAPAKTGATKSTTQAAPKSVYEAGTMKLQNLPGAPSEPIDTTPQAIMWAVPEKVSKNSKTTVYWKAQYVESCTVKSSDGSEFGTGLSGNRATPVLTRATVYTFECKTKAGQKLTTTVGIVVE